MNDFQTEIASVNTLQNGLHLKAEPTPVKRHPVEEYMMNDFSAERAASKKIETGLFGIGYAMEKDMEINTLSQICRPPVFQSSFALLNSATGRDEDIQVEDYLGAPVAASVNSVDVHTVMDSYYGF